MRKSSKYYDFCQRYKWFDWIDDHIIYYIYDVPYDKYSSIRHWFYCNWNKEHWNLLKRAFNSYGWDGYFIYELEEAQIDKQLKWFSNHQRMVDEQYNEIMWSLRIAKNLIHIINHETDLYHFEDGSESERPTHCYDGPYCNYKNAHRFLGFRDKQQTYKLHQEEYYMIKVKHLYHKIREKYTDYWWD